MRARTTRPRSAWASAVLIAAPPGPAVLAQPAGGGTGELSFLAPDWAKRFTRLDAHGDGRLSFEEMAAFEARER